MMECRFMTAAAQIQTDSFQCILHTSTAVCSLHQSQSQRPKAIPSLSDRTSRQLKYLIAKHVQEHSIKSIRYIPQHTSLAWNADTPQVLQHYASYSIRNDVSFYFNDVEPDWRLKYLIPMCLTNSGAGVILSSLFASLHRLRNDDGSTYYASQYLDNALREFREFWSSGDPIGKLACVMILLQHDVTTNQGQNLDDNLAAAAQLLSALDRRFLRLPLVQCLLTVHQSFDLANALLTGKTLYLSRESPVQDLSPEFFKIPASFATEDLWSVVHSIWSSMLPRISETKNGTDQTARWQACIVSLKGLTRLFAEDDRFRPHENQLQIACPIGTSLLYQRPSLRLIHSTIMMLVIIAAAYSDVPEFNVEVARDVVIRGHAHLFNAADERWNVIADESMLHQSFPATIPILLAASELAEYETSAQIWMFDAMLRCAAHGWTMGLMLLKILTFGQDPGRPKSWPKVGAKEFLRRCRSLQRPYTT